MSSWSCNDNCRIRDKNLTCTRKVLPLSSGVEQTTARKRILYYYTAKHFSFPPLLCFCASPLGTTTSHWLTVLSISLTSIPTLNSHFTQQAYSVTLKKEATHSSETSVDFYQHSQRHISEDGTSHYSGASVYELNPFLEAVRKPKCS
jgi:hypothetical protein